MKRKICVFTGTRAEYGLLKPLMNEIQKDNDLLVKADHDIDSAPLKKHTIEETLEVDPQLAVAILVVRTKLIEKDEKNFTMKCMNELKIKNK